MKRSVKRFEYGYTLIELTVVIAIASVLLGGGLISYQDFNQRKRVEDAALSAKNMLRVAQSKALSGEKPVGFTCNTLNGYRVQFTATRMELVVDCTNDTRAADVYELPAQVTFDPLPSSVIFKVLGDGVSEATTVNVSGYNREYQISVTKSGEIVDRGFVKP